MPEEKPLFTKEEAEALLKYKDNHFIELNKRIHQCSIIEQECKSLCYNLGDPRKIHCGAMNRTQICKHTWYAINNPGPFWVDLFEPKVTSSNSSFPKASCSTDFD